MQAIQRFFSWWTNSFNKKGLVGIIACGCVSLCMLCILCSIPIALLNPSNSTPETADIIGMEVTQSPISESVLPTKTKMVAIPPSETAITVFSPTETTTVTVFPSDTAVAIVLPTETRIPTIASSDTPAPTSTEEVSALLPGLMPSDVTVNLEERGFSCTNVDRGVLYYVRTCDIDAAGYALHVEIYGRELFSVDFIDSTVLQFTTPDNDFAASFLGFMATMPYDGAKQEEARSWVETTIPTLKGQGDVRENIFAGVNYRLYGIPTALILEIGNLP